MAKRKGKNKKTKKKKTKNEGEKKRNTEGLHLRLELLDIVRGLWPPLLFSSFFS